MTTRMLIDAAHPEETRVVVVRGSRLEEFDMESANRKQLRGNIYLAKVTRVEPSLQAAFVDYGGNRHGFLAFSDIHPDYYQIPIADRRVLLEQQAAIQAAQDQSDEESDAESAKPDSEDEVSAESESEEPDGADTDEIPRDAQESSAEEDGDDESDDETERTDASDPDDGKEDEEPDAEPEMQGSDAYVDESEEDGDTPDTAGYDGIADLDEWRRQLTRRYKIQEVIKRRQILLVQVVKEERGNKGAALTTYMSLAGRYCVLMPNSTRGGGISRKIANAADRKRLRGIIVGLDVPDGMRLIVRTAGEARNKAEIRRDYEYLLRLWDSIRELTLNSTAPSLIYEDANIIKRSIRDLYTKEISEVLIDGEEGHRSAKAFMKMLMPSHAKRVQPYNDRIPLFQRYRIEEQFTSMHSPTVELKSGGYIVINPTEALVAVDVNSGRSTRERNIEETAYKTNLEAAEEIARQLRLRDLAGLIVIDFIDMDENRNARKVEHCIKDCLKADRARTQVGRISSFGLLEMSRQRLRPSLIEASTETCPRCGGAGVIRSTESSALHVLHAIEEEGMQSRSSEITIHVAPAVAAYIFNQKRASLTALEQRFEFRVNLEADDSLTPPDYRIERIAARSAAAKKETQKDAKQEIEEEVEDEAEEKTEDQRTRAGEEETSEEAPKKRRRRGRRGGRRRRRKEETAESSGDVEAVAESGDTANGEAIVEAPVGANDDHRDTEAEVEDVAIAAEDSPNVGVEVEIDEANTDAGHGHEPEMPVPPPSDALGVEAIVVGATDIEDDGEILLASSPGFEESEEAPTASEQSDPDDESKPKRQGWWRRSTA